MDYAHGEVVYVLSTYREDGAENVVATLDKTKLPELYNLWFSSFGEPDNGLDLNANFLPSFEAYNLHSGWGGVQLHVLLLR